MSPHRGAADGAPLFAWGEAIRAARKRRRMRRYCALIGLGGLALATPSAWPPVPRLVWNGSASAPVGLYRVAPGAVTKVGDMVVARAPQAWRKLAADRHYLPRNVPVVKRVAAAAGNAVCARGDRIAVDGRAIAHRRRTDGAGRPMPWWSGCIRLSGGQRFLLMEAPGSFDGRYFGVTEGGDILGRAVLLWQR